eukprot:8415531-Lingulodinium_polyedra.AAC.1
MSNSLLLAPDSRTTLASCLAMPASVTSDAVITASNCGLPSSAMTKSSKVTFGSTFCSTPR